jgi:hypothetical protein
VSGKWREGEPDPVVYRMCAELLGVPADTLAGLRNGTLVAVPREPTEAMIYIGQMLSPSMTLTECYELTREFWAEMLAAAPGAGGGE